MSAKHDFRFSPHFLAQLPAFRSASGARWDVTAPLDVAFYCLQYSDRTNLGVRLLNLLINLTNTIHIDLAMLLNAVTNRLLALSAAEVQSIFALLPSSPVCLRFQISLCQLCLTDTPSCRGQQSRPRPQVKSVPRPLITQANQGSSSGLSSNNGAAASPTFARKFSAVQSAEILRIFAAPLSASNSDPISTSRKLQLKFR